MEESAHARKRVGPASNMRFGPFELDIRAGELRKEGRRIRLQEQPLQILRMLLESPGEVVLREEIRSRLWPNDTVVGRWSALAGTLRIAQKSRTPSN
jgi:DNA-binding response OmpR family regulator